jgi:hypothetical protein
MLKRLLWVSPHSIAAKGRRGQGVAGGPTRSCSSTQGERGVALAQAGSGSPVLTMRDAVEGCGSSFASRATYSAARSNSLFWVKGIGVFCETAAAFCLFFQGSQVHHPQTGRMPDSIIPFQFCRSFMSQSFPSGLPTPPTRFHSVPAWLPAPKFHSLTRCLGEGGHHADVSGLHD